MSKILEDISRTFNEFLLLPNLTDESQIMYHLRHHLLNLKKEKKQNIMQMYQWYLQLCNQYLEKKWELLLLEKVELHLFMVHNQ